MNEANGEKVAKNIGAQAVAHFADVRFFIAGGTLSRDAPSYIERKADHDLYTTLTEGQYAYVLDSRQKGKSSLVSRAMLRLEQAGIKTVKIDLQRVGSNLTPDQWYAALLRQIGRQMGCEEECFECWAKNDQLGPYARWLSTIEQVLLPLTKDPMVVFVDEVDFVRSLPFSADEFFAGIRECYNRRGYDPAFNRLTFCLIGSATPSQLVHNIAITPFNIGREVRLDDFSFADIAKYKNALNGARDGDTLLGRVYHWTHGHPFLTQAICAEIASDGTVTTAAGVDAVVKRMYLSTEARQREPNLLDVSRRLLETQVEGVSAEEARGQMLNAYTQVLNGKKLIVDDSEWRLAALRLCGAVKEENGSMVVRNEIYKQAFDKNWIRANMPDAELRRQKAAARKAMIRTGIISVFIVAVIAFMAVKNIALANEQRILASKAQYDSYCADMIECTLRWQDNDTTGLSELLDRHQDSKWKGWEWYFWKQRLGGKLLTFPGIVEPGLTYSLDGERIIVRGQDEVRRYSVDGLSLIDSFPMTPGPRYVTLEMRNGDFVDVTLGGVFRRIDPRTNNEEWKLTAAPLQWPNAHYVDPEGRYFLNSMERRLVLIDLEKGKISRSPLNDYFRPEFTRDPTPLICALDGEVHTGGGTDDLLVPLLIEPLTWKIVRKFAPARGASVLTASLAADLLVYGDHKSNVYSYEISTGKRRFIANLRGSRVWCVSFSSDLKLFAATTLDRKGAIFEVQGKNFRELRRIEGFYSFTFPHAGTHAMARHHPALLLQDDDFSRSEIVDRKESALFDGYVAYASPRGSQVIYSVERKNGQSFLVKRSVDTGDTNWQVVRELPPGLCMFGECDNVVVVRNQSGDRLFELGSGQLIRKFDQMNYLTDGVPGKDGRNWLVRKSKSGISKIDMVSGVESKLTNSISEFVDLLPESDTVVTSDLEGSVQLWNLKTFEMRSYNVTRFNINHGAFTPDQKTLVLAIDPNIVLIVDAATGRTIHRMHGHSSTVLTVAVSPDSKRVASGGVDRTIKIWDMKTGRMLSDLRGHEASVNFLRWLPGGKTIISGDADGVLRRWDGAESSN